VNKEAEQISKITAREFAESPLKVLPVAGKGFVNRVFLVETESFRLIFRTNKEDSLDEYEKEKWASTKAIEKQIPTPEILRTGVFDNQAYSIQRFVEGSEGRDFTINRLFIWEKFGEYAKRIHKVKVGGFGLKFRDMTTGDSKALWLEYL
jgi:hypothetical protein